MQPERYVKRVDPETAEIREEVNYWKVAGWVIFVLALTLAGVYLWHLFHGHEPILGWKAMAALCGGGMVLAGFMVTGGGDLLAEVVEHQWGSES